MWSNRFWLTATIRSQRERSSPSWNQALSALRWNSPGAGEPEYGNRTAPGGARFGHLTQNRNSPAADRSDLKHELDTVVSDAHCRAAGASEPDNKRIAGLELLRAEAMLDRRTIRSPVDGVVTERFKSAGEYIDDEPVMRVAQLDPARGR